MTLTCFLEMITSKDSNAVLSDWATFGHDWRLKFLDWRLATFWATCEQALAIFLTIGYFLKNVSLKKTTLNGKRSV